MKYALLMYLHKIINTRMKHGLKSGVFLKNKKKRILSEINVLYM